MSDISEGWYIPEPREGRRQIPRWVLGVMAGTVRYSSGGAHRMCTEKTFSNWIRRVRAARPKGRSR